MPVRQLSTQSPKPLQSVLSLRSNQPKQMNFTKSLAEYEQDLKSIKKTCAKLGKQYQNCTSVHETELIAEDLEDYRLDIIQLQITINEIIQNKPLKDCDASLFVY